MENIKTTIPKNLYRSIIRIQASEDVDFDEACEIAGKLVDPRRKDFEKAVKIQVDKRYKSELMTQVNKAKKTIGDKKFDEGMSLGVKLGKEYFAYPCNVCSEEIPLSDTTWESAKEFLTEKGWGHTSCHEQNN